MCGGFFCLSGLALSVKACRLCQLSQRESPWHNGKVSGTVQRRPLGGAGERSEPEGVASALPKAALQMSSPATTLLVKMRLERSAERDKRKNKNNPSSDYAQSTAEGILNRFVCLKRLSAEKQQTAFSAPPPCNLCNCDKFS